MSNKGCAPVVLRSLSLFIQNRRWFDIVNLSTFILTPEISEIVMIDFFQGTGPCLKTLSDKKLLQTDT